MSNQFPFNSLSELDHQIDELKNQLAAARNELMSKLDLPAEDRSRYDYADLEFSESKCERILTQLNEVTDQYNALITRQHVLVQVKA